MRQASNNDEVLDEVVRLNTDEQLFQGIDSEGTPLQDIGGKYSDNTVALKQLKGQPTDRVTLFDEGDFYDSFFATAEADGIEIMANYLKSGVDLRDRWGDELAGLTDESIEELKLTLIEKLINVIRQHK